MRFAICACACACARFHVSGLSVLPSLQIAHGKRNKINGLWGKRGNERLKEWKIALWLKIIAFLFRSKINELAGKLGQMQKRLQNALDDNRQMVFSVYTEWVNEREFEVANAKGLTSRTHAKLASQNIIKARSLRNNGEVIREKLAATARCRWQDTRG